MLLQKSTFFLKLSLSRLNFFDAASALSNPLKDPGDCELLYPSLSIHRAALVSGPHRYFSPRPKGARTTSPTSKSFIYSAKILWNKDNFGSNTWKPCKRNEMLWLSRKPRLVVKVKEEKKREKNQKKNFEEDERSPREHKSSTFQGYIRAFISNAIPPNRVGPSPLRFIFPSDAQSWTC